MNLETDRKRIDKHHEDDVSSPYSMTTALFLDAPILDQYFHESFLVPQIINLINSISSLQNDNQISVLINECLLPWILPMITFLWTRGQTPAVRLLGLQLVDATCKIEHHHQDNVADIPKRWQLLPYAIIRYVLPAFYHSMKVIWMEKIQQQQQQQQNSFESSAMTANNVRQRRRQSKHAELKRRGLQRQYAIAKALIQFVDRRWIPLYNIVGWLSCWSGILQRHSHLQNTSDLAMMLMGWTYQQQFKHRHATYPTDPSSSSSLNVDYAHRRWLWEEGLQTLQLYFSGLALLRTIWGPILYDRIVIPIVNRCRWWWYQNHKLVHNSMDPNKKKHHKNLHCPVCHETPTRATFVQPCGHVYCYVCFYKHHHENQSTASNSCRTDLGRCWECGDTILHAKDILSLNT